MREKVIKILGIHPKGTILYRSKIINHKGYVIIIEPIIAKEEEDIDKSSEIYGSIRYITKDNIIIPAKDIYLYGEVDFNNNNDLDNIRQFGLINDEDDAYNAVYSNFDFEKGTCTTINGIIKNHPTWNPVEWFKFKYVLIGKPKRVIVYRKYIKKR